MVVAGRKFLEEVYMSREDSGYEESVHFKQEAGVHIY